MMQKLSKIFAQKNLTALVAALPGVISIKAQIVQKDPFEQSERAFLNLGHTLAHALEGLAQKSPAEGSDLLHGDAVGVGLVMALTLSVHKNLIAQDYASQCLQMLKSSGVIMPRAKLQNVFSTPLAELGEDLWQLILQDKKAQKADTSSWVLLTKDAPGVALVEVSKEEFTQAYKKFLKAYEKTL
jgi:3-dehydroquinate synthase